MSPHQTPQPDPNSAGVPVPDHLKARIEAEIRERADEQFAGRFLRLDVRFKDQFCYIDACVDPEPFPPGFPPSSSKETPEAYIARMRKKAIPLGRLRYFGPGDCWSFGIQAVSTRRYDLTAFPSGAFFGPAVDAFQVVADELLA